MKERNKKSELSEEIELLKERNKKSELSEETELLKKRNKKEIKNWNLKRTIWKKYLYKIIKTNNISELY